jgi:ankyrin repeat protein
VALLVKEGADVNKKDKLGMTPLLEALRGGHDAAAQILVNNGAKPILKEAGTEMCKAAASRDMQYVERLVKAGVDPNVVDYSQRTPLHVVAAQGTAEAVKFLVQEGADVFARDRLVLYTETQRERDTHTHSICSTINAVMHLSAQFGVFLGVMLEEVMLMILKPNICHICPTIASFP